MNRPFLPAVPLRCDVVPVHRLMLLLALATAFWVPPSASAQSLGATMTNSLVATQGETLTYFVVVTNGTGGDLSGVTFSDMLDPNTSFVPGSLNTSPLAFADSYDAIGNVQITIDAPGVLANDVDADGVGSALMVLDFQATTAHGGSVVGNASGSFTYNPPRGFEGTDTFTYRLTDGEGFIDTGTVGVTVTGVVWFVNSAAPVNGDGRLTNPFSSLATFVSLNNGLGGNPNTNAVIFLYSGNYTGPLSLLNGQKVVGQGANASLSAISGLTPPAGSLPFPPTGGARPTIGGGANGIALAVGNLVRGLNVNNTGAFALSGGNVGSLIVADAAVSNRIDLVNGALDVVLDSVSVGGGVNGIRLLNCSGSFTVTGDGALSQNGSGGTIQNTTGNAVHLDSVANVSLARMNINNSAANGIFGQNVNGLVLDWCNLNNNGDAVDESGIRLGDPAAAVNGLTGSAPGGSNPTRIANTLIRASGEMNVAIFNNSGALARLEVMNVVSKDTRTRPLGADGFYFETRGSAAATVNFASCSFSNNFTQGIQASALAQSSLAINVQNCGFTNNNEGVVLANANDADLAFDINGNTFFNNLAAGASGSAIAVVNATTVTPSAIYSGAIRNNTIVGGGIDNHLITVLLAGAGNDTLDVANNTINAADAQFSGIFIQAGETGSGNLNASATVSGNTVSLGTLGSHGMVVQSRVTSTLCAEIANNVSTTLGAGLFGINVRQRDTSTFRLPGYVGAGGDTAAVIAFLHGKNPGTTAGATVATAYSGGAACMPPVLAMPAPLVPTSAPAPPGRLDGLSENKVASNSTSAERLESQSELHLLVPAPLLADASFAPLNIGNLPIGKSIVITFRVTVANPMPPGVCVISNQGIVSAAGGVTAVTDDPRTPAPFDPTLATVPAPPVAVTLAMTGITATGAQFHGTVNPGGLETSYYFIYRDSSSTQALSGAVAAGGLLPASCGPQPVNGSFGGFAPGGSYNFSLVASNSAGMAVGDILFFSTLPPSFLQQPEDALVCAGNTATFSVVVEGAAFGQFQWQRLDPGATSFQNIIDSTNAAYTTLPVSLADHGARFRVLFTIAGTNVLTSDVAVLSVNRLSNPTVTYDFNSGLPPNTVIYGHAFIDAMTGVLELNTNAPGQAGAFLTTDLAPGRVVRGFAATFRARLNQGSSPPADGFSFNWAPNLPNGTYALGEEGEGSGLRVCFDTWDNGAAGMPEAPAIDVWWGPNLVARQPVSIPFLVRGPDFFDVQIRLGPDGLLDVSYACETVFSSLPVAGYAPQMGARFGLGGRTGGAWETHSIDDLALKLDIDPTNGVPRITSIMPQSAVGMLISGTGVPHQSCSVEASTDLVTWTWRATLVVDEGGLWQFLEPNIVVPPYRFYRLATAPQFPPGLVTWWRADGNHFDSFGPHHGSPFDVAPDFAPGQRGAAFSFNGTNQIMFIGGADIPPPWTAAFWVKRQDAVETSAALLTSPSFGLKLEQWPSTRQVGFTAFGVADYSFNYIAPANTWTHLTFVGTPGATILYVNGFSQETNAATVNLPLNLLGGRENNLDHLQGLLDEAVLFNRALTAAEIQQVLNATRGP